MRMKALEALPFLNDPERVKEDERRQEIRRASFGRGRLTAEERMVSRGMALEEIARMNVRTMEVVREAGNNLRAKGGATQEMLDEEKAKLAEAIAKQGRYLEAAEHHPSKRMAAHYRALAEAIERDDDEECKCPPQKATLAGQEIEVDTHNASEIIYSPKHGQGVAVERCTSCGFVNARPARGKVAARLAEVSSRMKEARVERDARSEARASDAVRLRKR
jgi:hypothetical protein